MRLGEATHTTSMASLTSPSWAASSTTHPSQVYTCRVEGRPLAVSAITPCAELQQRAGRKCTPPVFGPSTRAAPPGTAPSRRSQPGPGSTARPHQRFRRSGVPRLAGDRVNTCVRMLTFKSSTLSCFTSMRSSCPCKQSRISTPLFRQ